VLGQLVRDREHVRTDPLIVGRQEPQQDRQEQRGIEHLQPVGLHEDPFGLQPVREDVVPDLLGHGVPSVDDLGTTHRRGEARTAIARHPAHDLRRREVPGLAANLPDAVVGLAPSSDRLFHLALEVLPVLVVQVLAGLQVEVDRVEERSPDVVLVLLERRVADPDRLRSLVPGQVIERGLREAFLPADPVHDLERTPVPDPILHEGEEIVRSESKPSV
jgi:hypothetical protein